MENTDKLKYAVSEKNADPKQAVIEKSGHVIHFTIAEIEQNDADLEKSRKEVAAKKNYEEARITNVTEHHPKILELTGEELMAAYIYQEAKSMVKACDDKLAEIDGQLADDRQEIDIILKQLPELNTSKVEVTDKS